MLEDIKAILFDLDGTLYDNIGVGLRLVKSRPLHAFRMKKERSVRKSLKGVCFPTSDDFYSNFAIRLGSLSENCPEAKKQKVMDWYYNLYLPAMNKVIERNNPARPGLVPLLESLKARGFKLGVLSDYEKSEEKLGMLGIDSALFDSIASSADFGGLKPCVECFNGMAERMGVEPCQVLVVGDRNDTDGEGARRAGMKFVQIRTEKACRKEAKGKNSGLIEGAMYWEDFSARLLEEIKD